MAEAELELVKTIKYIEERERSLSRYSDKLRRSLERIFNVFGNPNSCQICGLSEWSGFHKKYYYYDCNHPQASVSATDDPKSLESYTSYKIVVLEQENPVERWAWDDVKKERYVYVNKNQHKFTPKVFVSIDIEDTLPFYTVEDDEVIDEYYLAFRKHELAIVVWTRYKGESWTSSVRTYGVDQVSRECLKALVKSGRLLEFLKTVSEKLQKMSEEYKEVSEIAEKMAKAIES